LGVMVLAAITSLKKIKVFNIKPLAAVVMAAVFCGLLIFYPFLGSRNPKNDNALRERIEYNRIGLEIIKDNAVTGTGFGQSLLHMNQYSIQKMWPWDIQPIHNYFLISAAEGGVIFSLLLFLVFSQHIFFALKSSGYYSQILGVLIICYMLLMLTDHYFYTLPQTMLLLWLVLGIVPHETKNLPN
jgi:hypothetical protein